MLNVRLAISFIKCILFRPHRTRNDTVRLAGR